MHVSKTATQEDAKQPVVPRHLEDIIEVRLMIGTRLFLDINCLRADNDSRSPSIKSERGRDLAAISAKG